MPIAKLWHPVLGDHAVDLENDGQPGGFLYEVVESEEERTSRELRWQLRHTFSPLKMPTETDIRNFG